MVELEVVFDSHVRGEWRGVWICALFRLRWCGWFFRFWRLLNDDLGRFRRLLCFGFFVGEVRILRRGVGFRGVGGRANKIFTVLKNKGAVGLLKLALEGAQGDQIVWVQMMAEGI